MTATSCVGSCARNASGTPISLLYELAEASTRKRAPSVATPGSPPPGPPPGPRPPTAPAAPRAIASATKSWPSRWSRSAKKSVPGSRMRESKAPPRKVSDGSAVPRTTRPALASRRRPSVNTSGAMLDASRPIGLDPRVAGRALRHVAEDPHRRHGAEELRCQALQNDDDDEVRIRRGHGSDERADV